jgi:eukaryotic-like serine/threonine-protein kinase
MPSSPPKGTAPFPEKVGKYELLLPIGSGGMATVFLARSLGVGGFARDVALKLVHSHLRADDDSKMHLLEEAKLSARIRHPNVVSVQEVDEDPFGLFLVMDYVEGDNLAGLERAARKAGKPLTDRLIARLINDALLGLHAAHELCDDRGSPLGIVHRDFTPQNILVSVEGITRLTDFGVAKAADRAVRTKTGLIKGKIAYMAPEQARGHKLDRRCDVWAAGVVAWELIARRRLYTSEDDVTTLLRIVTERPLRLREVAPQIPEEIDNAVAWALEPDVEQRCPTAETFRATLEAAFAKYEGMADTSELGVFVRDCVGHKLVERQASITEMRSLRLRIGELTRPADPSDSDPNNDHPTHLVARSFDPPPISGHSATIPSLPANVAAQGSRPPLVSVQTLPIAPGEPPELLTETSAVLPAFVDKRPGRLAWGALALVAAGLVTVALVNQGPPSANTAASPNPSVHSEPTPNITPQPAREPAAAADIAVSNLPEATDVEALKPAPPPTRAKTRVSKPRPTPAAKPTPAEKPGLASSPYGAQKSRP